MPMPVLGPYAAELYEQLTPLQHREAELDYPLAKFIRALCLNHEAVEEVARETGTGDDPFSILLDLPRAPSYVLPWLAQFVGATIPANLNDAQQRARITTVQGYHRGTRTALQTAIKEVLTGNKTVYIDERDGGPYRLTVETYTDETPNPDAVLAAIAEHKPAGVVLNYRLLAGVSYDRLADSRRTYTQIDVAYGTYADMREANE